MAKSANYSDALHRLVVALNETGIRYALTGAAAVGYYGIPRTSMDIDVVMRGNLSDAQIETLATALSKNGFTASKKEIHRAVDGSEVKFQAFDDRSGYLRIDMFLENSFGRVSARIDGLTVWFRTFEELLAKRKSLASLTPDKRRSLIDSSKEPRKRIRCDFFPIDDSQWSAGLSLERI